MYKMLYSRYRKRRPTTRKVVRRSTKRYARKTYKPRVYTKVIRQPGGVPDRMFVKLRYVDDIVFNTNTVGVLYPYLYQSSIYDPDFTSTGHQPLWRDQYVTLYNNYRVWGIGYKTIWKQQATQTFTMAYIAHQTSTTTDTDPNLLSERITTKKNIVDINRPTYMRGYLSVAKVYGISKREFVADDGFQSAMGANPSKQAFLATYVMTRNASATTVMHIELTYYVELFNRVYQIGS